MLDDAVLMCAGLVLGSVYTDAIDLGTTLEINIRRIGSFIHFQLNSKIRDIN